MYARTHTASERDPLDHAPIRRWHTAPAQSSEALNHSAQWVSGLIVRCPPAPLPRPLPRTPLLILMPAARNAGGALCAGRSALQKGAGGGPTGVSDTMQARASEFLEHHASPMPKVTRTPSQTHQAPQFILAGLGKGRSAAPGGRGHCA